MKKIILITIFLIIIPFAFADYLDGTPNTITSITTACFRNYELVENANVSIIIYNSTGGILAQGYSDLTSNGTFVYNYVFTDVGYYTTRETCDFNDYLADGSTTINIKDNSGTIDYDLIANAVWNSDKNCLQNGNCSGWWINTTLTNITTTQNNIYVEVNNIINTLSTMVDSIWNYSSRYIYGIIN